MPGWKTTIAHSKSISDLPPNAKAYVEKIWELTGIPGELTVIGDVPYCTMSCEISMREMK